MFLMLMGFERILPLAAFWLAGILVIGVIRLAIRGRSDLTRDELLDTVVMYPSAFMPKLPSAFMSTLKQPAFRKFAIMAAVALVPLSIWRGLQIAAGSTNGVGIIIFVLEIAALIAIAILLRPRRP
jgi:hypothetical protein